MSSEIKKSMKSVKGKIPLPEVKKTQTPYPSLNFFPLSEKNSEKLCQDIKKNIFQLEKNLAFFYFAIEEIKEITNK